MSNTRKRRQFSRRRNQSRHTRGFHSLVERLEDRRMLAMTYVVNSTGDAPEPPVHVGDGFLTLREAVLLVNGALALADLSPAEAVQTGMSPPTDVTDTIKFNIPFNDPGHIYYHDDGIPGQVTLTNVFVTTTIDDGDIRDIDPDWQYSWNSIQLVEPLLVTTACTIDGYSALKAHQNTNSVGQGLNTVLRMEVWTAGIGNFFQLLAPGPNETVVRGLCINGGGSAIQTGKVLLSDMANVRLEGNFIGPDISGTHLFDNFSNGIQTVVTPLMPGLPVPTGGTHLIGGTTPETRNLLSGNRYAYLSNDTIATMTVKIEGNLIGTNSSGMPLHDDAGNPLLGNERGFYIIRTDSSYTVGGPTTDSTNVISNNQIGALVDTTSSATIENNLFGTDPTGVLDVGNSAVGVLLRSGRNVIQHNTIAFNGIAPPPLIGAPAGFTEPAGLRVFVLPGDPGLRNILSQNSIFANYGPGIDLKDDGVTPNDLGDVDSGPNHLQNFPILDVATATMSETTVTGTLNSQPNMTYRVEIFSTPTTLPIAEADDTAGKVYLGFVDVTTDAMGNAVINFTTPTVLPDNEFITATATLLDAMMNQVETSEFSNRIQVNLPTFSIDDVSATEGNTGTRSVTFTVTLSHDQVVPVTVTVNTTDDTATLVDNDYQEVNGLVLTFQPGDPLTQTVTVRVVGDTKAELDETYFVKLSNSVNATIADDTGVGTIVNDDYPAVSIDDVEVVEGDSGTTSAVFTVSLSQAPAQTLTIAVDTADGTATLVDNDYQQVSSLVLTFDPGGPLAQTVTVLVNGDTNIEVIETFSVLLSAPVNATIADGTGQGTILNDDFPTLSINDVTVTEGDSGTTNAVFTVTLSTTPAGPVTVHVDTTSGTAKLADNDYEEVNDLVLTFNPGDPLTQTVTVLINGDFKIEEDEDFFVNLSNSVNAAILDDQGRGTIATDDFPSVLPKDLLILGSEIGGDVFTRVKVIDVKNGGQLLKTFTPYGSSFHGGVRVALGDMNSDGVAEIITAPGPGRSGLVKVFNLNGQELTAYRTNAYPSSFLGGVFVAVGDVNGDGRLDVITTPGEGTSVEVKVFRNRSSSTNPIVNEPLRRFLAFGSTFNGGASVAAGDLTGDGKADVVVGSGKGMGPHVRAFDLTTFSTTGLAPRMFEILPFSSSQRNGVFVAVGDLRGNSSPEIIVGSSTSATGQVKLYNSDGTRFKTIDAFPDSDQTGPVHVVAKEIDQDDALLEIVTAQGFTGNRHRRSWQPDGSLIDDVFESDSPLFRGYYLA